MRKSLHYLSSYHRWQYIFSGVEEYRDGTIPIYDFTIGFPRKSPWFRARLIAGIGLRIFAKYVQKYGMPDLIHTHDIMVGGLLACSIKESHDVPVILTEHSASFLDSTISKPNQISLVKHILNEIDQILAVGPTLANSLHRYIPNKSVDMIGNLIDTQFFHPPQIQPSNPPFIFSLIALLDKNKGVDILLRAFEKACKGQAAELNIAGDGIEKENLERLAIALGIKTQVHFTGLLTRSDVRDLIQGSHVIISSSYVETFGITLIESLACGKPVIASRSGGPLAFVNDENGLLVPPGDVDALADALTKMISQYSQYDLHVIRAECVALYSKEAFMKRLEALYEKSISNHA